MSIDYLLRKTRAKALLEKALLDPVVENQIYSESGKTELINGVNPFQRKAKKRLHKSSGLLFKQRETVNSRYPCLTTATFVKPRGEVIDSSEEIPSWNLTKVPDRHMLSLENISRARTSTKIRNAAPRLSLNLASSIAGNTNKRFTKAKRRLSCPSLSSIIGTSSEDLRVFHRLITQRSGELKLDYKESGSSIEFLRYSPTIVRVNEESDYYPFPQISASDSEISDWQDEFSFPESDSEFNAARSSLEPTDSWSYSLGTWGSRSNSRMLKPIYKSTLKPEDIPPAGMLFAAWFNTKIGNRYKTFHLYEKLQTVIDWLGTPLPIVIQEPGCGGRRCDCDLTLAQALGKMFQSPSQQGVAFFTGPVNGKLSYLMTIVDLNQLCALKRTEDEKLEKEKSWL